MSCSTTSGRPMLGCCGGSPCPPGFTFVGEGEGTKSHQLIVSEQTYHASRVLSGCPIFFNLPPQAFTPALAPGIWRWHFLQTGQGFIVGQILLTNFRLPDLSITGPCAGAGLSGDVGMFTPESSGEVSLPSGCGPFGFCLDRTGTVGNTTLVYTLDLTWLRVNPP